MNQHHLIAEIMERRAARKQDRRTFLKVAGATSAALASTSILAACGGDDTGSVVQPPPATTQVADSDVLNFALNLEYLEAQFYSYAATGAGLPSAMLGGKGTQGQVTGGRMVNFMGDTTVQLYANEISADETAHVAFLRSALGSAAVAQPALDISADPNGAFSTAARAAGLVGPGQSFDPYASPENFLLGAFIFEDVGVTAYKGASPLIQNKTFLEAAAGILAAEAYHAGLIRTTLYRKGLQTPALIDATEAISNARDSLDGPTDDDQGIRPMNGASNIVPANSDGIAYSRTPGQVLDVVFLTKMAATKGGFFPNGVNGLINTSAAS